MWQKGITSWASLVLLVISREWTNMAAPWGVVVACFFTFKQPGRLYQGKTLRCSDQRQKSTSLNFCINVNRRTTQCLQMEIILTCFVFRPTSNCSIVAWNPLRVRRLPLTSRGNWVIAWNPLSLSSSFDLHKQLGKNYWHVRGLQDTWTRKKR